MPLQKTITLTGNGSTTSNSDPYRLNWRDSQTTLVFTTDGSTTGFTVQYTLNIPEDYASASAWASAATWIDVENTTLGVDLAGITADAQGTLEAPIQGIRLQADGSGTDTGTLQIAQNSK